MSAFCLALIQLLSGLCPAIVRPLLLKHKTTKHENAYIFSIAVLRSLPAQAMPPSPRPWETWPAQFCNAFSQQPAQVLSNMSGRAADIVDIATLRCSASPLGRPQALVVGTNHSVHYEAWRDDGRLETTSTGSVPFLVGHGRYMSIAELFQTQG